MTIPEKGTHEDTALAVSNQTGIDEREIQKVTRLLFGKKSSWHNFRHILPQSIQTSAAYNPRSLTRKQPCLSQFCVNKIKRLTKPRNKSPGRGLLPYIAYTGKCRWTGYGFWPLCPKQGTKF